MAGRMKAASIESVLNLYQIQKHVSERDRMPELF
jgi:hypothetical protein